MGKLEKAEKERDYWKNSYLEFRQACLSYVEGDDLDVLKSLVRKE